MAQPLLCLLGCPNSLVHCTFCHKVPQMGSYLEMLDTHYYKKTPPNANNLPIWMVYPSHTSLVCLLSPDLLFMSTHMTMDGKLC
jgi:hypothetical protein